MTNRPFLLRTLLIALTVMPALQIARASAGEFPRTAPVVFAAEADADGGEAEDESTILGWISKSGWSGYIFFGVLALFSIVAMTIAFERLVNLTREKLLPQSFLAGFRQLVDRGEPDPDQLARLCRDVDAPVAKILRAGLLRAGRPLPEVEKAMEDTAAREISSIRSKSRPLTVIGSVAPLVGLLGTVVGMILAFHTTSQAGTGKAELLAEGIYLALLTTAAGLTIAIPCMLLAAYFNTRLERFMREIDEALMLAMPGFTEMERQYDLQLLPPKVQTEAPEPELAAT